MIWNPTVARQSVAPLTRSGTWWPIGWATVGALVLVVQVLHGPDAAPGTIGSRLRIVTALLAGSLAFALDDAAAPTVSPSPTSLPARRTLRVGIAAAALALGWLAVLGYASTGPVPIDVRASTVELAALGAVALAVSSWATARDDRGQGGTAGFLAPATVLLTSLFMQWASWWPYPTDPAAPGAGGKFAAVTVVALAILVHTSGDPARDRRRVLPLVR